MNPTGAVRYLESFVDYEKMTNFDRKAFNPEAMMVLANFFGNPQKSFSSVHIAGTKGKGSIANFIASMLTESGFRTGLYTSPHIKNVRERIKINDKMISESDFVLEASKIKHVLKTKKMKFKPTFFEMMTILAFNYFKQKKIDFGVIETGLGGRLDATNIINPLISVISPVSYDHMHILGKSLRSIAREKSAIIKKNVVCVSAPQKKAVLEIIKKKCKASNAELILVGKNIKNEEISCNDKKEVFNIKGILGTYKACSSRLLGSHQIRNACSAVAIAEALIKQNKKIKPGDIKRGIFKTRNYGRCEVIRRKPYVVLDGAQNAASARALKETIKRNFRYNKLILVLGVSKKKDTSGICRELVPLADEIILTRAKTDRALQPVLIKKFIKNKGTIITGSVPEAMEKAIKLANFDDLIVVTGSLYIIGEIDAKKKSYL